MRDFIVIIVSNSVEWSACPLLGFPAACVACLHPPIGRLVLVVRCISHQLPPLKLLLFTSTHWHIMKENKQNHNKQKEMKTTKHTTNLDNKGLYYVLWYTQLILNHDLFQVLFTGHFFTVDNFQVISYGIWLTGHVYYWLFFRLRFNWTLFTGHLCHWTIAFRCQYLFTFSFPPTLIHFRFLTVYYFCQYLETR